MRGKSPGIGNREIIAHKMVGRVEGSWWLVCRIPVTTDESEVTHHSQLHSLDEKTKFLILSYTSRTLRNRNDYVFMYLALIRDSSSH